MSKANQRFVNSQGLGTGLKTHAQEGDYKIPIKHRKAFMSNNESKWVKKEKYKKYLDWCTVNG